MADKRPDEFPRLATPSLRDLTPAQAARQLGHGREYVMQLIQDGELEARDVRSPSASLPRFRITLEALKAWKRSRRVPSPSTLREVPLQTLCGIYFLCDAVAVVYVGQSTDVQGRIQQHRHEGMKEFNTAFALPFPQEKLIAQERRFIDLFQPKYNADGTTRLRRMMAGAQ